MSLIKRTIQISAIMSLMLLVMILTSAFVCADSPMPIPMRLDITITGMPGSSCHLQVYNTSGLVADFPSAGSTVSNVNVFGSDGSAIHYHVDGRDTGVTTTLKGGGYAQVSLAYPPAPATPTPTAIPTFTPTPLPSPSASATANPSSGNGGSFTYGNGGIVTVTPTPSSVVTETPSTSATVTATTAPTVTPTPTPTPTPSPTVTADNGFPVVAAVNIPGDHRYRRRSLLDVLQEPIKRQRTGITSCYPPTIFFNNISFLKIITLIK